MPDRAIVSLVPAVATGFILGLIAAVLQMNNSSALVLGIVGLVTTAAFGGSSIIGTRGKTADKPIVALLRIGLAGGMFALIYVGMIAFLREGNPLLALGVWALAILCGIPLSRIRVRGPQSRDSGQSSASPSH